MDGGVRGAGPSRTFRCTSAGRGAYGPDRPIRAFRFESLQHALTAMPVPFTVRAAARRYGSKWPADYRRRGSDPGSVPSAVPGTVPGFLGPMGVPRDIEGTGDPS